MEWNFIDLPVTHSRFIEADFIEADFIEADFIGPIQNDKFVYL